LRRWGVGLIVLQRDAGGFLRTRHNFYPFVDQQPGKWLADVNRRRRLNGEGELSTRQALSGFQGQADPAVLVVEGKLRDGQFKFLARVECFGIVKGGIKSGDAIAHARHPLEPRAC